MSLARRRLLLSVLAVAATVGLPAQAQDRPGRRGRRGRGQGQAAGERRSDHPHQTLTYGPAPLQALDVYDNPGATGPVLAFVHGGGWAHGDKSMVNRLPDYAERYGLTLVSIGYRLVPEVSAREQAEDVAAAVATIRRTLPGRPIVLVGHSAGAHLVALVGVDPAYLGNHGLAPSDLAAVIPLDGAGYDATEPRRAGPVGRWLEQTYEAAFGDQRAELSPILRIGPGWAYPPFLIFHIASRDDAARQSRRLAEALTAAGGQAEVVVAPGDTHRDINVEFGQAGDAEGERAAAFIRSLG
ncbi:MAG TPA: alpha/beta hydrolase [Brevundimonas sp.]|jgi:arylformamidase|uniref:alpha/beta hydrolase n=1 Tax=Brevundimonas sp. TaxID=1871086 RepID=UPI002C82CFD6|nr:alpha/beta hydrolase [Brevundimonas sp.]HRH19651.1 alpha/beta hydrolase [Brevundimonas sp.]